MISGAGKLPGATRQARSARLVASRGSRLECAFALGFACVACTRDTAATREAVVGRPASDCVLQQPIDGLRRFGRARIRMTGGGYDLFERDLPAICGALYVHDTARSQYTAEGTRTVRYRAGDGFEFQACSSRGLLRVDREIRMPGLQPRHSNSGGNVTVGFHPSGGGSSLGMGPQHESSAQIVVSPDFQHVDINLYLNTFSSPNPVHVVAEVDCH